MPWKSGNKLWEYLEEKQTQQFQGWSQLDKFKDFKEFCMAEVKWKSGIYEFSLS